MYRACRRDLRYSVIKFCGVMVWFVWLRADVPESILEDFFGAQR